MHMYNTNMKGYQGDYAEATAALEAALRKREQIDAEIDSLQERIRALETLIRIAYPVKDQRPTRVDPAVVVVTDMKVTERVRGLLMAASGPLTSGDIQAELRRLGWNVKSEGSNPWALIHGICRRLVEQGFAKEVNKGGRKAWMVIM
jgi:hypothetical protein